MSVSVTWKPLSVRGRLSLIISRDLKTEPRLSIGSSFSNAGQIFSYELDASAGAGKFPTTNQASFPFQMLEDFPPGQINIQAVLTPYVQYNRADGISVWLPGFQSLTYSEDYDSYGWANVTQPFGGSKGLSAEGALYSTPKLHVMPFDATLELELINVVPNFPKHLPETSMQKYVTIVSKNLTKFWGRPVNVSAWVTLPAGFHERPNAHYPLIINHGHYSYQRLRGWSDKPPRGEVTPPKTKTDNPDDCYYCSSGGGCCEDCTFSSSYQQMYAHWFTGNWTSLDVSSSFYQHRVLLIRVQSPNPYFDDSYAMNSENLGPWGDAITYELIPEIERKFRGIGEGWARGTYGGSTGAWEALGVQIKYPNQYNGAIACAPDPIDFRALSPINIYDQTNAFRSSCSSNNKDTCPLQLLSDQVGSARTYTGKMLATIEDDFNFEIALGGPLSGGQIGVWFAVYGPKNQTTGLPIPLWDESGAIDPSVAKYWRDNYDLSYIVKRDWKKLSKLLKGKIHVWVGSMDAYYLDAAVYLMENRMLTLDPPADADFRYGTSRGRGYSHAWKGDNSTSAEIGDLTMHQRLIPVLVDGFLERAPKDADVTSWRY